MNRLSSGSCALISVQLRRLMRPTLLSSSVLSASAAMELYPDQVEETNLAFLVAVMVYVALYVCVPATQRRLAATRSSTGVTLRSSHSRTGVTTICCDTDSFFVVLPYSINLYIRANVRAQPHHAQRTKAAKAWFSSNVSISALFTIVTGGVHPSLSLSCSIFITNPGTRAAQGPLQCAVRECAASVLSYSIRTASNPTTTRH